MAVNHHQSALIQSYLIQKKTPRHRKGFLQLYILYFKPQLGGIGLPEDYLFGISPEGIGTIGMIINFIVSLIVSRLTKPTPEKIKDLVESIRYPK